MKRQTILRLGILCFTVAVQRYIFADVEPLPSIKISDSKDLADVLALNKNLSALSQKVTTCVNAGGVPKTCQCSDSALLKSLRDRYNTLVKQHPGWKDKLLSYEYVNEEGRNMSGTLVLSNLRRQLEMLKCE